MKKSQLVLHQEFAEIYESLVVGDGTKTQCKDKYSALLTELKKE